MVVVSEFLIRRPIAVIRSFACGVCGTYGGALSDGDAVKPTQEEVTCAIRAAEL